MYLVDDFVSVLPGTLTLKGYLISFLFRILNEKAFDAYEHFFRKIADVVELIGPEGDALAPTRARDEPVILHAVLL